MKADIIRRFTYLWLLLALCSGVAHAVTPSAALVRKQMSGFVVPFEANVGQADSRVAFAAHTFAGTVFVTHTGRLVHSFPGRLLKEKGSRARGRGWVLTERLLGRHPDVRGEVPSAARASRFAGNDPKKWQSSIPTFEKVGLGEAWPGIAVSLVAHGDNVEKFFTVAAGADARHIAVRLDGAKRLALGPDGGLVARTGNGPVKFSAPRAWQDIGNERRPVRVAYTLVGNRYGFRLGVHDPSRSVVIDPLLVSTYLGGGAIDVAKAVAIDGPGGSVFVAGYTASNPFPNTAGPQVGYGGGNEDAFVVKLNNGLTGVVHATYLGGSGDDLASALVLDSAGNVFVAGQTTSTNFPQANSGVQPANAGGTDGFVVKLDNTLTTIVKATYLGGSGYDALFAMALDGNDLFVTGHTGTTHLPAAYLAGAAQPNYGGGTTDGWIVKLDTGLSAIARMTYVGNSDVDSAHAIAVDASHNVYVAGSTHSSSFLGTVGGAEPYTNGGWDGFVAKLDNGLTTFTKATFLGGSGDDDIYGIALSPGAVFVAGRTLSTNWQFTNPPVAQASHGGGVADAVVVKLNTGLTAINKVTYLGGTGYDTALAIALDSAGNVIVTGETSSSNLPGRTGGAQASFAGGNGDAFVTRLNGSLTAITQSTYLGDTQEDSGNAVALDPLDNTVLVAGQTASTNFPGRAQGAQTGYGGPSYDGFISKLTHGLHDLAHSTANNDGDPHITTVDGGHYNIQGAGEYVSLTDSGGLEIQTRETPISTAPPFPGPDYYDGVASCVSVNTAVASRVGAHRVTYEPELSGIPDPNGLQLRVDGVLVTPSAPGLSLGAGGRVASAPLGGGIQIDFPDGTVLIVNQTWSPSQNLWVLDVDVFNADADAGLMGAIPAGSWLPALPDGTSVGPMPAGTAQRYAVLYGTFASAWRVSNASSLFDYRPGTSTATFTFTGWPMQSLPCQKPRSAAVAVKQLALGAAREICLPVKQKGANADCVFDVAVTGEPGLVNAYLVKERIAAGGTRTSLRLDRVGTLVATVKPLTAISRTTPTGSVQFSVDGRIAGAPVKLDGNAQAKWEPAKLAGRDVVATYMPAADSGLLPSSGLSELKSGGR